MPLTLDGSNGVTFPAGGTGNPAGTVVGTSDTQTMTNKTIGSGYAGSTIVLGTAQNSTSGTNIDFTGIPSWVKRITVMFNGVSTNGTSIVQVQLGISSGVVTTGYTTVGSAVGAASAGSSSYTSGFGIGESNAATRTKNGAVVFSLVTGNTWTGYGACSDSSSARTDFSYGVMALSGTLDRIRITTVNGTDTFDAGSINIIYE